MGRFSRIICLWLTGTCGKSGRGGRSLVREERAPDILKNKNIPKVKAESDPSGRIQTPSRCVRMGLGKPKPTWTWIWWKTWRTTTKPAVGQCELEEEKGKHGGCCWLGQGPNTSFLWAGCSWGTPGSSREHGQTSIYMELGFTLQTPLCCSC